MFTNIEFADMSMEEYHARPEINMSKVNAICDRSVAHMLHETKEPKPPTPEMAFGTAFHTALLEPEKFKPFIIPKVDRRTNAGKEAYATAIASAPKDATMLSQEEYDTILGMLDSVKSNEQLSKVLDSKGWSEKVIFATDEATGLRVKIRVDFYSRKFKTAIDIKTTKEASEHSFKGDIWRFRYYRSFAFYKDILLASGIPFTDYRLLAVEKEAPYGFTAWDIGDTLMLRGRAEYRSALSKIAEYKRTGVANSYRAVDGGFTFLMD